MNTLFCLRRRAELLGLFSLFLVPCSVLSQGPLTPPGAPAPTMKTLDQVEARKPIPGGTSPFTISSSGSYYLTGNITVASGDVITINASNVTLDLNGYTLATTSATPLGTAIVIINGGVRVTVCNGFILGPGTTASGNYSGGGFYNGFALASGLSSSDSVVARDLTVSGCANVGIGFNSPPAPGSIVERCVVKNTGFRGIVAEMVRGCRVQTGAGGGLDATVVTDCLVNAWTSGISTSEVSNSQATTNSGTAVACSAAQNSVGNSSSGPGLTATTATNCTGANLNGGGAGLTATTATNCVGSSGGSQRGLDASTAIGCKGTSIGGIGLFAVNAQGCTGISSTSIGLQTGTGTDCAGQTDTGFHGLYGNILTTCQGIATGGTGIGLEGFYTATNCLGLSQGGIGLYSKVATNCLGDSTSGPWAIYTTIAIGCKSINITNIFANFRYNQPE